MQPSGTIESFINKVIYNRYIDADNEPRQEEAELGVDGVVYIKQMDHPFRVVITGENGLCKVVFSINEIDFVDIGSDLDKEIKEELCKQVKR